MPITEKFEALSESDKTRFKEISGILNDTYVPFDWNLHTTESLLPASQASPELWSAVQSLFSEYYVQRCYHVTKKFKNDVLWLEEQKEKPSSPNYYKEVEDWVRFHNGLVKFSFHFSKLNRSPAFVQDLLKWESRLNPFEPGEYEPENQRYLIANKGRTTTGQSLNQESGKETQDTQTTQPEASGSGQQIPTREITTSSEDPPVSKPSPVVTASTQTTSSVVTTGDKEKQRYVQAPVSTDVEQPQSIAIIDTGNNNIIISRETDISSIPHTPRPSVTKVVSFRDTGKMTSTSVKTVKSLTSQGQNTHFTKPQSNTTQTDISGITSTVSTAHTPLMSLGNVSGIAAHNMQQTSGIVGSARQLQKTKKNTQTSRKNREESSSDDSDDDSESEDDDRYQRRSYYYPSGDDYGDNNGNDDGDDGGDSPSDDSDDDYRKYKKKKKKKEKKKKRSSSKIDFPDHSEGNLSYQEDKIRTCDFMPKPYVSGKTDPASHLQLFDLYLGQQRKLDEATKITRFQTTLSETVLIWASGRHWRHFQQLKHAFLTREMKITDRTTALHTFRQMKVAPGQTYGDFAIKLKTVARVLGYEKEMILDQFISALPGECRKAVSMQSPTRLTKAVKLSELYNAQSFDDEEQIKENVTPTPVVNALQIASSPEEPSPYALRKEEVSNQYNDYRRNQYGRNNDRGQQQFQQNKNKTNNKQNTPQTCSQCGCTHKQNQPCMISQINQTVMKLDTQMAQLTNRMNLQESNRQQTYSQPRDGRQRGQQWNRYQNNQQPNYDSNPFPQNQNQYRGQQQRYNNNNRNRNNNWNRNQNNRNDGNRNFNRNNQNFRQPYGQNKYNANAVHMSNHEGQPLNEQDLNTGLGPNNMSN